MDDQSPLQARRQPIALGETRRQMVIVSAVPAADVAVVIDVTLVTAAIVIVVVVVVVTIVIVSVTAVMVAIVIVPAIVVSTIMVAIMVLRHGNGA